MGEWARESDNGPDVAEPCDCCPWAAECILVSEAIDPENICKRACSHRNTIFRVSFITHRRGHFCRGCGADLNPLDSERILDDWDGMPPGAHP